MGADLDWIGYLNRRYIRIMTGSDWIGSIRKLGKIGVEESMLKGQLEKMLFQRPESLF